jgi:hypothetical protein
MPLFITSDPGALHGVFARFIAPPATIDAQGTGTSVIVGQLPWGPPNVLTYPDGMGSFIQTFAPPGMDHTGSAYLSVIRKGWPLLGAVRVADPAAVAAHATLASVAPANLLTVPARCTGAAGNSIVAVVSAADDANANHFNMTVSVTGASGTTTESYRNLNISGTGADVFPNTANSVLIGPCTKLLAGIPVLATYAFGSGTSGTVTAAHYLGTQGTGGAYGLSLTEGDDTIDLIFFDDPGNAIRAACNAGMLNHCNFLGSRIGVIAGPSGQTAAQAQADAANYTSQWVWYTDPWTNVTTDDTSGSVFLIPGPSWGASVAAQVPASVSPAWKRDVQSQMLSGITSLEALRGPNARAANTQAGVSTLMKRSQRGGFAFEAAVVTTQTAGEKLLTDSRMDLFIASSVVDAWIPWTDAPNISFYQNDLVHALDGFLDGLKKNATEDPEHSEFIVDYEILPLSSTNTAASIAAGQFTIGVNVQYGSQMSQIFFNLQGGETVSVSVAQAA